MYKGTFFQEMLDLNSEVLLKKKKRWISVLWGSLPSTSFRTIPCLSGLESSTQLGCDETILPCVVVQDVISNGNRFLKWHIRFSFMNRAYWPTWLLTSVLFPFIQQVQYPGISAWPTGTYDSSRSFINAVWKETFFVFNVRARAVSRIHHANKCCRTKVVITLHCVGDRISTMLRIVKAGTCLPASAWLAHWETPEPRCCCCWPWPNICSKKLNWANATGSSQKAEIISNDERRVFMIASTVVVKRQHNLQTMTRSTSHWQPLALHKHIDIDLLSL